MPYFQLAEGYLTINTLSRNNAHHRLQNSLYMWSPVKSTHTLIFSGNGQFNIPFSTVSRNSLFLSAPSCPSHSFIAENSSLTFSNKKHTRQVSSRGRLHAPVTGQTRSLAFFQKVTPSHWVGYDLFPVHRKVTTPDVHHPFSRSLFFSILFLGWCQARKLRH